MSATLLQQGDAFLSSGRLSEAESCYAKILASNPAHPQALERHALVALRGGNLDDAQTRYTDLIERHPNLVQGYVGLGNAAFRSKNFAAAESAFLKAKNLFPNHPSVLNGYAQLAAFGGRTEEALEVYHSIVAKFPDFAQAYLDYSRLMLDVGCVEKAKDILHKGLQRYPNHIGMRLRNALISVRQQDYSTAHTLYMQLVASHPTNETALVGACDALISLARLKEAESLLGSALSGALSNSATLMERFAHIASCAGDNILACQRFEALLSKHPNFPNGYASYSSLLMNIGKFSEASRILGEAISRFPNNPDFKYSFAQIAHIQLNKSEAVQLFSDLVENHPTYIKGYLGKSSVLAAAGKREDASEVLRAAIKINPSNPVVRNKLGEFSLASHDYKTAFDSFLHNWLHFENSAAFVVNPFEKFNQCGLHEEAIGVAAPMLNESLNNNYLDRFTYQLALTYLYMNKVDEAEELLGQVWPNAARHPARALAKAKVAVLQGDLEAALRFAHEIDLSVEFEDSHLFAFRAAYFFQNYKLASSISAASQNSSHWQFDYIFHEQAMKNDAFSRAASLMDKHNKNIILYISSGRSSLLPEWIERIKEHGRKHNIVIVGLDHQITNLIKQHGMEDRSIILDVFRPKQEFLYSLARFRVLFTVQMQSLGYPVMMSGVDAFWNKDFFAHPLIAECSPHVMSGKDRGTTNFIRSKWGGFVLNSDTLYLNFQQLSEKLNHSFVSSIFLFPYMHDQEITAYSVHRAFPDIEWCARDDHSVSNGPCRVIAFGNSVIERDCKLNSLSDSAFIIHKPFYKES